MQSNRSRWLLVALLSTGLAFDYASRLALFSVLPLWRNDLHASEAALGLVASSFLWTYGLLSPLAGFAGDRFSRRTVLIASLAAWSAITLLSGLVTNAWQLVGMRILLALAQVCYLPVGQAFLADFHGPATRGRASGYFQSGCSIGIFLSGFPVAWLATHLGWRGMLIAAGTAGLAFSLVLWRWLPQIPRNHASTKSATTEPISVRDTAALLRISSVRALMATFTLTSITYWVLFSYLPLFVYERYGLSVEAAAFQATF